ncbi:MAG: multicopper oxidase domain-containing protein [Methylophilaceae bacterium]|uniref:multicopper oxidase domain-containing protein n=1 Tax=Methylobacillus sp. MM3 TaxID=1848039 RepID=UPI00196A0094|nr:multicopper oxidase domain-containing protein [Methylobacillus sp. MM3]
MLIAAALLLASCDRQTPQADPYDQSKMDLHLVPAKLTDERHQGAFAEGNALSMGAELKPLDPAPVKTIRLDTTHKIIDIAPGVKFSAWTFGDQVPAPTIRARVGDKIKFSMSNRSDEPVPGVQLTAAPMMHSMDFHAAMVSPQDKYRSIAPGQTIEFEFTLNYPGIFMYHCGTPMILEHIASGMYGALVVEPRDGYPTKVNREYVIIQSEFYAKPDPSGRKVDTAPLYVLDGDRLRVSQPTHIVFNGTHNGMVKHPLPAKPGERVRLYVLNVGPSKTSSFHVVGTIFDRVWIEGNPDNQFRGMQTVLLGSSNSAVVEFVIPEEGSYIMVDHHFANASQGAIGLISTTAAAQEKDIEHHNIPASATPTDPDAAQGKLDFESKCLACHTVGGGDKVGPDLAGVTKRRSDDWLARWLKEPEKMLEIDADAKAMLKQFNNLPMPNQNLTDKEISRYIQYFHWIDTQPAGTAKIAETH